MEISGDPIAKLKHRLDDVLAGGDLDALLAALVLRTSYRDPAASPWAAAISDLCTSTSNASGTLRRPSEVAVLGCRLSLGSSPERAEEFHEAAVHELRRTACPPLPTAHDDDRILLGIAAGIGTLKPEQRPSLAPALQGDKAGTDRAIVEIWAQSLADGYPQFNPSLAREAIPWLTVSRGQAAGQEGADISGFWLASRLLSTPADWQDAELQRMVNRCADGRTSALGWVVDADLLRPLDIAFLFDALSSAPAERLVRQSALHGVLAVVDSFSAAASVLEHRQRSRPPLEITDEYDVQDLFRALALPVVPDIEPEDPAPKVATKSSRLDFTSKRSRIGFEMKHVKGPAHVEKVRDEILIDEATFYMHPYVDTVVAFIYDPNRYVSLDRRTSIEDDLSGTITIDGRSVQYFVRIRG